MFGGGSTSASKLLDVGWGPAVGQELLDAALGPPALQLRDHVRGVGERVDAGALAGVDDGAGVGDVGGAVLAAGEQVVQESCVKGLGGDGRLLLCNYSALLIAASTTQDEMSFSAACAQASPFKVAEM